MKNPRPKAGTALFILGALLILPPGEAKATRYYTPKFEALLLVGDKLVFCEPGLEPHRLICISKASGQQLWELIDVNQKVQPWFLLNNQLIVTDGSEIQTCDTNSGRLSPLYQTPFDADIHLYANDDGSLLIHGARENVDYLICLTPGPWRQVWAAPLITYITALGTNALLCEEAVRKPWPNGGYSLMRERWVALSKKDGQVLWSRSPFASNPAAVGDYFLVYLKDTIYCLNQLDGTTNSQYKTHEEPYTPIIFATENQRLLVSGHQKTFFPSYDTFCFSLSVPALQSREITYQDWLRAANKPFLVQDEQYVYSSSITSDRQYIRIIKKDRNTGAEETIYQEPVPPNLRTPVMLSHTQFVAPDK